MLVLEVAATGGGQLLMEKLCTQASILGAQVHFNSRVLALVVDHDRRVVGVVSRESGKLRFIHACKGVILCTGGFIGNGDTVKRFVPQRPIAKYKSAPVMMMAQAFVWA